LFAPVKDKEFCLALYYGFQPFLLLNAIKIPWFFHFDSTFRFTSWITLWITWWKQETICF